MDFFYLALRGLPFFLPGILGVLALTVLRSRTPENLRREVELVAIAGPALLCVLTVVCLVVGSGGGLNREFMAYLVINSVAPLISLISLRFFTPEDAFSRSLAFILGMIPIVFGPVIVLVVHCTTGIASRSLAAA